jgi:hypothetical protein
MPDDPSITDEKNSGGLGGASAVKVKDVRLTAMALAQHWPISQEARDAAIKMLEDIILNPQSSKRAKRYVIKTFASLSRINLSVVDTAIRAQQHEELEPRIAELERRVPRVTQNET